MNNDIITTAPGIYNKSWSRQRILKRKSTPSYQEIVNLAYGFDTLQERVLFSLCYLTGGRISEIVKLPFRYKNKYKRIKTDKGKIQFKIIKREKLQHGYPGLVGRDITTDFLSGLKVLIISMENRKNKEEQRKTIPIPIEKEEELVKLIQEYIFNLGFNQPLFDFGVRKAQTIINQAGFNPHFLRDIRATHLALNYNFTEYQLIQFMGWTDGRPASKYVRRNWRKIIQNFK